MPGSMTKLQGTPEFHLMEARAREAHAIHQQQKRTRDQATIERLRGAVVVWGRHPVFLVACLVLLISLSAFMALLGILRDPGHIVEYFIGLRV
jgi:hypothetical protein